MTLGAPKTFRLSTFLLIVSLMTSIYMLTYRAVIQSGDTLRTLDALTSFSRHDDWLMDESNWFKPALSIRHDIDLPLSEYDVEERLNVRLALPLLKIAEALPRLGIIHTVWLFNVFVTALCIGMIYLLACTLNYADEVAVLVAITAGLSTNLWAYSQTFFREPLSAFFILVALLVIQLGRRRRFRVRLFSLIMAAAGLYLAYLTKFSATFAIPAALLFALPDVRHFDQRARRRLALALLSLTLFILVMLMIVDPLPSALQDFLDPFPFGTAYIAAALRSYILSPGASIWGTSPIVLLTVAGGILLWRQRQYRLVLAICLLVASYAIGHALSTGPYWFGGLSWPPRFLLPVLPALILATAPVAEKILRPGYRVLRILWALLLIYGAWIQFNSVALSWEHIGTTLPAEANGLSEWLPSMMRPEYFRWVVLPQRWNDLGFDFLWTRSNLPFWGISFTLIACAISATIFRLLIQRQSRWRYSSPLLATICLLLIYLNLALAYYKDPRTHSQQRALHEILDYFETAARADDILLLPGNDYGDFILNHLDQAAPRPIILPRPLAQAASDKQPAQIVSNNSNSWFDVQTVRVIQHLADHHDRLWVLENTSPFMSWSFRPLERYLALHAYPVQEIRLTEPSDIVRLLEYSVGSPAPNPMSLFQGDVATDLRYGENIALLSFVMPKQGQYRPGNTVEFSLLWQTETRLEQSYTVATFVVDAKTGQPTAQGQDSGPQNGFAPTRDWIPAAPIWDNRAIRLPLDAKPGDYRLWVLLYHIDSNSGDIVRLPVRGSDITGEGNIGVLPLTLQIE